MEFKDVIYGRRSVREYSDKKIDDDVIKEILDAAMWAPSGVNIQPWYYVVIKSKEGLEKITELMEEVAIKNKSHLEERFSKYPDVIKNTLNFIAKLGNAPTVILVFRDKKDYSYALPDDGVVQSISASVENLILSAYDHGISSCWMTAPHQANMGEVFREKFAENHGKLVCMLTLGYAKNTKVAKAPKRKKNKYEII